MDKIDAGIIVTYARCNMVQSVTARKLYRSETNIGLHLDKVKRLTGLDPRNFFDLHELYEIARGILTDDEIEAI